jgi:hypothetical protein
LGVKLLEAAQKSWRRLDGHNQLPKLVLGVTFNNGIEVDRPSNQQSISVCDLVTSRDCNQANSCGQID